MTWYVNEYLIDRAYGGPEEGGWWYDTRRFIECHGQFEDEAVARNLVHHLRETRIAPLNEGRRPITEILGEGLYEVCLDDCPGHNEPAGRPCYE